MGLNKSYGGGADGKNVNMNNSSSIYSGYMLEKIIIKK